MCRVLFRISVALVGISLAFAVIQSPVQARARIIAVVILRSTPTAKAAARATSKALASRLAQESGWDAVMIDAHGKAPADAAAAVGAELFVVGQYFSGPSARISGATYRVATDERLTDFSFNLDGATKIPPSVSFAQITAAQPQSANLAATMQVRTPAAPAAISVPSGELISVAILNDIGSRISQEGDAFAVQTVQDYYYKGQLILPKGSPGYGVITHLKRAGSFHSGGELNFTVKRLVTPSKTDVLVETNGATADADKTTEHNGNAFGQYLLWGVGMFAKRGNDILIKKGTTFHVSTLENANVPIAPGNAVPAALDPAYTINTTGYVPPQAPQPEVSAQPAVNVESVSTQTQVVISPPPTWLNKPWNSTSADFTNVGYWVSPGQDETLAVIAQAVPNGMSADQFFQLTVQSLQNSVGSQNVRTSKADRICNGAINGWYVETSVIVGGTPMIAQQTIGVAGQQAFIATYRRPSSLSENASARSALESLCPVSG